MKQGIRRIVLETEGGTLISVEGFKTMKFRIWGKPGGKRRLYLRAVIGDIPASFKPMFPKKKKQ